MLDPKLLEDIAAAWHDDQEHPLRGRTKRSLPPKPVLRQFVETCFLASLKQEEGRPVPFSAVLVSESDATDTSTNYRTELLRLESPIPFTAHSVLKLAPALDPELSSLAVGPVEKSPELFCWGVFSFQPRSNYFTEIPVAIEGGQYFWPDHFTISSTAAGSLSFSRGFAMLGRLVSGQFIRASPTPFSEASLGGIWLEHVARTQTFRDHGHDYARLTLYALRVLLDEAARRGHGGTIVVAPPPNVAEETHYTPNRVLVGEQQLRQRIVQCMEWERKLRNPQVSSGFGIASHRITFETVQRLSQLAAIDGALILSDELDVVAFGTTLRAPRWSGRTVAFGTLGAGAEQHFDLKLHGTRHRSAIDFAGARPDAIVFVISQDGPIRAFARHDESTVLFWEDLTSTMSM
ncbi:MAG: putative sensor domain DACNV-containing protein [Archangium sp.]